MNAATSKASEAPGTITSRLALINSQELSYPLSGKCENFSREGVSSGSSTSEDLDAEEDDDEAKVSVAAATPLGLMTSNSVFVDLALSASMAPLMGGGGGFAGTYFSEKKDNHE